MHAYRRTLKTTVSCQPRFLSASLPPSLILFPIASHTIDFHTFSSITVFLYNGNDTVDLRLNESNNL